jgi:putative methyltransferase (TIGR04325 family)
MSQRERVERVVGALQRLPIAGTLLRRRYERDFLTPRGQDCWYGVYPTFTAAAAAAPDRLPVGYDQTTAKNLYDSANYRRVLARDYPVLYWLQRVLGPGSRLFDFGGHVGVTFHAYRPYLAPDHMPDWTVCDVPAVVEEGAARAAAEGETALHFTTEFADASGADVLLVAGALQYIEPPLDTLVGALAEPPKYVILNKLPTTAREHITLQNIGVAYCPYRIAARGSLPGLLAAVGYDQVDEWENPGEFRTSLPYSDAGPVTWVGSVYRRRGEG